MSHTVFPVHQRDVSLLNLTSRLPQHATLVCHLSSSENAFDSQQLHAHMRALSAAHLECFFCGLDADAATTMRAMVRIERFPALLLCRDGRVVDQLAGIDRSFTTEGIAYELAVHRMLNFEEGTRYGGGGSEDDDGSEDGSGHESG